MSDLTPRNPETPETPDQGLTRLICRFCDGELDANEAAEFEERIVADPDLAGRVRFERAFRERVARAMRDMDSAAPADLAARVRSALADAETVSATPATPELRLTSAAAAPPTHGAGRDRAPVSPPKRAAASAAASPAPRANIFAVAATIAVIAGAVLFGVFGRPIDSIKPPTVEPVTGIAQFVSNEHQRCAGDRAARERKAAWRGAADAAAGLRAHLGIDVPIFEIGSYRFVGAGGCHVPGDGRSAHLVYASDTPGRDGCPQALLSLFVVPNPGWSPLGPTGVLEPWVWAKIGDQPECAKTVACSDDGRLLYFLVCCNDADVPDLAGEISRAARRAGR